MGKLRAQLENIRVQESLFALPFGYLGMILAAKGLPSLHELLWASIALFAARTMAMSMNRVIHLAEDRLNPRTLHRPLVAGHLRVREVVALSIACGAVLLFAAWQLNELCVKLFPVAVLILIGYSYTKRLTWLSHFVVGLADGGAPIGGWVAVTGSLGWEPILLGLVVTTWIGGFDIVYACQDIDFDRRMGLRSIPARFGVQGALIFARLSHLVTLSLLAVLGIRLELGPIYGVGLLAAAALLAYQHAQIASKDLARASAAFLRTNGYISLVMFFATVVAVYMNT